MPLQRSISRVVPLLICAVLLLTSTPRIAIAQAQLFSDATPQATAPTPSPLHFVEDVGQFGGSNRFQLLGGDWPLWIENGNVWVTVYDISAVGTAESALAERLVSPEPPRHRGRGANVRLHFAGANRAPLVIPFARQETAVSYFRGNDPGQWHTDVPVWGGLRYVDLYPGLDLVIDGTRGRWNWQLECTMHNCSDALKLVHLQADGAELTTTDSAAATIDPAQAATLRVKTVFGDVTLPQLGISGMNATLAPVATITGAEQPVASTSLAGGAVTDVHADLAYGTFLGGGGEDIGSAIAVDGTGAAYLAGLTYPAGFPTTPGAFDISFNGNYDMFIAKLNPTGSSLAYATFLGSDGYDYVHAIAVDSTGAAYVAGETYSANFPTTPGAFDTTHAGAALGDAYVAKLSPTGSSLAYSTLLGGDSWDYAHALAVDGTGVVYVAGRTLSDDFPTTSGALDTTYNGDDAFIAKLNSTGSSLSYATVLGGGSYDNAYALAVDGAGAAYVAGVTQSSDFPATPGAFDAAYNGDKDAFVVKLDPAGSSLAFATFVGTAKGDYAFGLGIDGTGAPYVAGWTESADFPTTAGAFAEDFNGGYNDAFIAKLDPTGSSLVYSSFLGGAAHDFANALAVSATGIAYVAGDTQSSNFPTTPGVLDTSYGGDDAFVVALNSTGTGLTYGTFLAGDTNDFAHALAVDGTGAVYVTGYTGSFDFPTTSGAFDATHDQVSNADVYVAKLNPSGAPPFNRAKLVSQADSPTVLPGASFQFRIDVRNTGNTIWRAADGYGYRGTDQWLGREGVIGYDVPPGNMFTFSETVTAPITPGKYAYGFVLRQGATDFGPHFLLEATVTDPPPTYTISGKVWRDGALAPAVTVEARANGTIKATATSGTDGTYTISSLPAATYTVQLASSSETLTYPAQSVQVTLPGTAAASVNFWRYSCAGAPSGLNLCQVQPGDILLSSSLATGDDKSAAALWTKLGGSYFTHGALYLGILPDPANPLAVGPRIAEAQGITNGMDDVWETSLTSTDFWSGEHLTDWSVVRPQTTPAQVDQASDYARAKAVENGVTFSMSAGLDSATEFYCSKLVWKSYQAAGLDVGRPISPIKPCPPFKVPGMVPPDDLFCGSPEVQHMQTGSGQEVKRWLLTLYNPAAVAAVAITGHDVVDTAHAPAHLLLINDAQQRTGYDPASQAVLTEIPGAVYSGPNAPYETISFAAPLPSTGLHLIVSGVAEGQYGLQMAAIGESGSAVVTELTTAPGQLAVVNVTDSQAEFAQQDVAPPNVSISVDAEMLTVFATDPSGVKAVYYSFDGVTFEPYAGSAVQVPQGAMTALAYAVDALGNRSSILTFQLATPTTPPVYLPTVQR